MMNHEDAMRVSNDMIEKYGLETFQDAADMCKTLQLFAQASLSFADDNEYDGVTVENLKNLDVLLDIVSRMFLNCDEYFRR